MMGRVVCSSSTVLLGVDLGGHLVSFVSALQVCYMLPWSYTPLAVVN